MVVYLDRLARSSMGQIADCKNLFAANSQVGPVPWISTAVHDAAVPNNHVEILVLCGHRRKCDQQDHHQGTEVRRESPSAKRIEFTIHVRLR